MSGVGVVGVRGRKQERINAEDAETQRRGEEENKGRKRRAVALLDRKNPPFAKCAKDGAPSRSVVGWHNRRSKSTGRNACATGGGRSWRGGGRGGCGIRVRRGRSCVRRRGCLRRRRRGCGVGWLRRRVGKR